MYHLQGLILEYPQSFYAQEADKFLQRVVAHIDRDYTHGYYLQDVGLGFYQKILKDVSLGLGQQDDNNLKNNFEIFNTLRNDLKDYIINIKEENNMQDNSYYQVSYLTCLKNSPPLFRSAYTNSTNFGGISKIQLSWENSEGLEITGWLKSFLVGDMIKIGIEGDDLSWGIYSIQSIIIKFNDSENGYVDLEVSSIETRGVEYMVGQDKLLFSHYNIAESGSSGTSGSSGSSGISGSSGSSGISGSSGSSGISGRNGTSGTSGLIPPTVINQIVYHLEQIIVSLKAIVGNSGSAGSAGSAGMSS